MSTWGYNNSGATHTFADETLKACLLNQHKSQPYPYSYGAEENAFGLLQDGDKFYHCFLLSDWEWNNHSGIKVLTLGHNNFTSTFIDLRAYLHWARHYMETKEMNINYKKHKEKHIICWNTLQTLSSVAGCRQTVRVIGLQQWNHIKLISCLYHVSKKLCFTKMC